MKGLPAVPQSSDLKHAYDQLQVPGQTVQLSSLSLFSQWTRFDPRLAEILVSFIARHWKELSPLELKSEIEKQPWPSAFGVLLEFSAHAIPEKKLFKHWKNLVMADLKPAPWQQFFIGLTRLGSDLKTARFSFHEYKKWGYFGREILFNKQKLSNSKVSSLSRETRIEILKTLIETNRVITVKAYWEALSRCISIRQAERDLRSLKFLKPVGQTKGRVFRR